MGVPRSERAAEALGNHPDARSAAARAGRGHDRARERRGDRRVARVAGPGSANQELVARVPGPLPGDAHVFRRLSISKTLPTSTTLRRV